MNLKSRKLLAVICSALFVGVVGYASTPAASAASIPSSTVTAALVTPVRVHSAPTTKSRTISVVADTRPVTGSQTVLPVIGQSGSGTSLWLRVLLPQRPNSISGWIQAADVETSSTPWYIVVIRSERKAFLYKNGHLNKTFTVIVGAPSTPTPSGHFFVAEIVHEGYGIVTGPYALLTSAYSDVFQIFEGGPGQVALHGIVGLDNPLGTAESHGCVRFSDADVTYLATHVGDGTPIDIQ